MDKKKSVPQPSSSSEESSSGEEDENEQGFVRSDRKAETIDDKKVLKSDDGSESEGGEEEDDDDDDEIDGTQNLKAGEASSSEDKQPSHGEGESDSDSETSSASHGKLTKPSKQFVVLPRKAENGNGPTGKKTPTSEKSLKHDMKLETSLKKGKDKPSKRDREVELVSEKGSSKKLKKERADVAGESVEHVPKSQKASKDKSAPSSASEKNSKKSATAIPEKPEYAPIQQNSAKKPEGGSAKKVAEKGKNDKKAAKNTDVEAAKGSLSPTKPKLFTGKDELVLTSEILHDIQKGLEIPSKKSDGYWSELADRVEERMEGSWSKEKLHDKLKRMKVRYGSMADKFRDNHERKFRNSVDQELFAMWDQLWGNGEAPKVDDSGDAKKTQTKVLAAASPAKGGKAPRGKVAAAPVQDMKAMAEESEGHHGNEDVPESEESDGGSDSPKKELIVTPMEVDSKDAHADRILVPENIADTTLSLSVIEAQNRFHKEIQATLAEIQDSSRQTLKEWQSKALGVVENAVKTVADQARIMNGFGIGGFDGLASPLRSLDMSDSQLCEGDQALQQQWHELRLKELDVYRQRLELMQRECQLKHDQLKGQLQKNK